MQNSSPRTSPAWRPLLWSAALLLAVSSFFGTNAQAQNIYDLLDVGVTPLGECCFKFVVENNTRDTSIKRVAIDVIGGGITSSG